MRSRIIWYVPITALAVVLIVKVISSDPEPTSAPPTPVQNVEQNFEIQQTDRAELAAVVSRDAERQEEQWRARQRELRQQERREAASTDPAPVSGETTVSGGEATTGAGSLPEPWRSLAECESTLNPQAVNPDGPYYGLFQFLQSTWESVGGTGNPAQASVAEQLKRAQILQARSGWGQWPSCARQIGVL